MMRHDKLQMLVLKEGPKNTRRPLLHERLATDSSSISDYVGVVVVVGVCVYSVSGMRLW